MVTVFDRAGEIDGPAISRNVAQWIKAGVGGVVALGSNGEAPFVEEDEAERVIAAARDSVPRDRVLLVGTGRESTRATIAASARAAALGADLLSVAVCRRDRRDPRGVVRPAGVVRRAA